MVAMSIKFSGIQLIPYIKSADQISIYVKMTMRRNTDHMNFEAPLPKSTENKDLFQVLGLTGLTGS